MSTAYQPFMAYQNFRGIPVTGALSDPSQARDTLNDMALNYPGELFSLEFAEPDDGIVVTWIPQAFLGSYLSQSLTASLTKPWQWADQF